MDTINQPTINSKNEDALPSLGKAGTAKPCNQMHCEMHKTGNYAEKQTFEDQPTKESKQAAAEELRGLVRAYLCR